MEVMMKPRFMTAYLVFGLAAGCGSPSSEASTTSNFVGTWTYERGATIVADCPSGQIETIDLSSVPPAHRPGSFTLSSADATDLHELDARGCAYAWTVSGEIATAAPGQTCATFPDGRGGNRLVRIESGTKTTRDGASMTVDVHFTTDALSSCAIHVQGTATKS
jgi:hypothetical protein